MKQIATALAASGLVLGATAATAEISGNVAMTTDYLFRGISQTDNSPAIQGGFDYEHESGFYTGIWASNVDFDDSIEIDIYAGVSGELEGVSWDIGALAYIYPGDGFAGAPDSNYEEFGGSLGYDFGAFDASIGVWWSPDFFAESDDATYISLDVGVPLGENYTLALHYGNQSVDDEDAFWGTATNNKSDWDDYSVGISTEAMGLGFDLTWSDTNVDKGECFGGGNICDSTVIFTVSKSL